MLVTIRPAPGGIGGVIAAPPSKSMAHRAVLCAALAVGRSHITHLEFSKDISATLSAAAQLCAAVDTGADDATVQGLGHFLPLTAPVDCCESGSTLRFLIPIASLTGQPVTFTGRGRLMERPQKPYLDLFDEKGISYEQAAGALTVRGTLTPGEYRLAGNVSSQFFTGLLFALPLLGGGSTLVSTTRLESRDYVAMTRDALARAGVKIDGEAERFAVPPSVYRFFDAAVEADWSQAAFLLAAGALAGDVRLQGLSLPSAQGDSAALALFRRFGADIATDAGGIRCRRAPLHGIDIDAAQIPDLVPILAVTAAFAEGVTHIFHAERLRIKESDRLAATADGLRRLGARVEETADGLRIHGGGPLTGGEVDGCNDHRIVMSMAVAALRCSGPAYCRW